jgi:hypothetical protein
MRIPQRDYHFVAECETEREEKRKEHAGEQFETLHLTGGSGDEFIMAMKVPRQYPFVLLAKIS